MDTIGAVLFDLEREIDRVGGLSISQAEMQLVTAVSDGLCIYQGYGPDSFRMKAGGVRYHGRDAHLVHEIATELPEHSAGFHAIDRARARVARMVAPSDVIESATFAVDEVISRWPGNLKRVGRPRDTGYQASDAPLPGLSNSLPARRDVLGGPVQNSGGVGPDIISPIYTSTDRKDPLARALLESGVTVSKPSRGNMTPEQYDRYEADAGKLVRDTLTPVVGGPVWSTLSPEDRQDYAAGVIRKARRTVRDQMGVSMKKAPTRRPVPDGVPTADPWAAFPDAR